ncbi:MAG TPA: hypothetical protein VL283_05570 [Candidatus Baltobacteraceae bacterium]|nr:hypothetical protein [Candidatus Baltobacteraceae bacterium]
MSEAFHFQFSSRDVLAISWASDRPDYVAGDCYVVAVGTTYRQLERHRFCLTAMTIDRIRAYVAERPQALGSQIHDCLGIILIDDNYRVVPFPEPVQVRNHEAP